MEKTVITHNGRKMNGEISVIKVKGYLDVITSEELDVAIDELLTAKHFNIIIDLYEVEYISSMGWSVFLSKINEVRLNDGDLKLARIQPNVYQVFKILEFEWFLNTYPSVEAAAAEFNLNGHTVYQR
ncbi:MAG: STAS domain-containing protein [bacterium]